MRGRRSSFRLWTERLTRQWPVEAADRERAFVVPAAIMMAGSVPLFALFGLQYLLLELRLAAVALALAGLWVSSCVLALPRAGGLRWPIHGFCLAISSTLLFISLDSGGVQAPAFYWLIVVAPIAVNFLPWRDALIWVFVAVGLVGVLTYASSSGWVPVARLQMRTENALHSLSMIGLLIVTSSLGFLFRSSNAQSLGRFKRINRELEEARQRAHVANEAKGRFLANMSHEIRTPMNAVVGMAELLATSDLPTEHRSMAHTIQASAASLLGIVNDVLDLSTIEAEQLKLESESFDLDAVIRQVMEMMGVTALQKRLSLELDSPLEGPTWVLGDPVRVRQILANLVSNGLKFTAEGQVGIRVSPYQNGVSFEVWDTGIGMSPAVRERLFDPFFQADASTRRRFGGTGLGLSISERLVREMGGKLEVESEEGEGTRFRFTLPLLKAEAPDSGPGREETGVSGLKVLVVEDNRVNREVVQRMLTRLGCEVEMAVDGEDALKCCGLEAYDALLMDCDMPIMDGFQCTEELRRRYGRTHRIIAFSASVDVLDRERCRAAGMDDFLPKPVRLDGLREVLSRAVKGRAQGDLFETQLTGRTPDVMSAE